MAVEVDGGTHSEPEEVALEVERTRVLTALGYKLIRIRNQDVYENIDGVLECILATLLKRRE